MLKSKANTLVQAFHMVFKTICEKSKADVPVKFAEYFLNMSHKLCSSRTLMRAVNEQQLIIFTEEMLIRLISEEENKNEEMKNAHDEVKASNETVIKTLNSIVLRILENSHPNVMFGVLFDLLIKYRRQASYVKILGLIVKCILKLTKVLEQMLPHLNPEVILLKSHLYLIEFAGENKPADDMGIKMIKTILNELVKVLKEKIWDSYKAVQQHGTPDHSLQRWITVILKPAVNVSPRVQGTVSPVPQLESEKKHLPSPLTKQNLQIAVQQPPVLPSQLNSNNVSGVPISSEIKPEIKELIDNLKRRENFETGILKLHEILQANPGHDLTPYFKDCSKTFVEYVKCALERANGLKTLGNAPQSHQNNIGSNTTMTIFQSQPPKPLSVHDARLATKTAAINPSANIPSIRINKGSPYGAALPENIQQQLPPQLLSNQQPQQNMPQVTGGSMKETTKVVLNSNSNLDEFHSKIANFKNKFGMATGSEGGVPSGLDARNIENNMNLTNQPSQFQGVSKLSMNSVNNPNVPIANVQLMANQPALNAINDAANYDSLGGIQGTHGKKTDSLLQKLNEMKLKMQGFMNKPPGAP
jgi:hypothetical protein